MNPIEEQQALIDQLYRIVIESMPKVATEAGCRFEFHQSGDGSRSVDEQFWYVLDGKNVSALLNRPSDREWRPIRLVPQLHAKMKAHTGGDWQAFTLTINGDGSVTTRFEYSDQQP